MKLFTRRFQENAMITLVVALLCSVLYGAGVASLLDARFSDLLFIPREPAGNVVIVAIDDASIQALGQWPWKRATHARVIDALRESGAKVIGYDVNFPEMSSHGASDDAALAVAIQKVPVVLPVEMKVTRIGGEWSGTDPLYPVNALRTAAVATGLVNVPTDGDGVARTVPLWVMTSGGKAESFALVLARKAGIMSAETGARREMGSVSDDEMGTSLRVNYVGGPGAFLRVSVLDVLEGRVGAGVLRDKIVLVGATAPNLHDDMLVPTSAGAPMPGVEVHANILDTLTRGNGLRSLPLGVAFAMLFLYALIVGLLVTRSKLRYGTSALIGLLVLHILLALFAFDVGVVVPVLWPALTLLITYVVIVAVRYFHEQRERLKLRNTLNQYLSPAVVSDLLTHPDKLKLGGERRTMTVLFSDLRGFTTLSEGLPPETLVHILNTYLDVMTEKVFQTNGVVDKYMGDAIMAFWGASFLETDHADRALTTAILMRTVLNEMNAAKAWPNGVVLNLGIGVNTGDMVVGNMGSSKRFDYTVMGDAVNLGSRIEGINKEYGTQIIATEFARKAASEGKFVFKALDLVAVKGKKEPVPIFEVVGLAREVNAVTLERVARFEEAVTLYRKQEFAAALVRFKELSAEGDVTAPMYVGRCEAFMEHGPGNDWNGVWVFTKK